MIELLLYLILSILINILMFIPAYMLRTDRLTDMSYSLTFIIIIFLSILLNNISDYKLLLAIMILLWSLRLGIYLIIRIMKIRKDSRFDGIRESFFAFLKFWLLQGISVFIILIPSLFFIISQNNKVFWFGALLWFMGLIIETIADIQKYVYKINNKKGFITTGLWEYSRHPNYFGEILCWIGIYLFVMPSLTITQIIIGFASPLFITILLLYITGIPPLERYQDSKFKNNKEYNDYKKRTSILIPWFTK